MSLFTTCIITVSNETRAQEYTKLIERRRTHGLYPSEIDFKVYSDPGTGRVGSGGAVLLAIKQFIDENEMNNADRKIPFSTGRVLVLNAGGDSDSLTTFAAEGIPFTPVPVDSSSTMPPVMLDLQLDFFLKYPWRDDEVVVAPADVYINCDPVLFDVKRGDIHGFAFPASFDKGSTHGVFRFDAYMHSVTGYFQKKEVSFLKRNGFIDGTDTCAVDTGIVSLSSSFVAALLNFSQNDFAGDTIFDGLNSGKIYFDLYQELVTSTLSREKREQNSDLQDQNSLKKRLFSAMCEQFKSFTLTASLLKNVEFFHVENLKQYMDLCAGLQSKQTSLWYNGQFAELRVTNMSGWILFGCSHIQMPLKKGKVSLIEGSSSCTIENALGENIFSGIKNWQTDITIPEGICIDCRVADQNNVFLVYKNTDHFSKPGTAETLTFCGKILEKWLTERCLTLSDIGVEQEPFRLADAQLFRANVSDDFLSGYWNVPSGKQWKEKFCFSHRYSLSECSSAQIGLEKDMQRQKLRASVLHTLIINGKGWVSAGVNDFEEAFLGDENNNTLEKIFETTSDILTKKYRGRLLDSIRGSRSHSSSIGFFEEHSVVKMVGGPYSLKKGQTIIVRCPVRLDLAGGWSDMPPFTLKHGGAVVNVAVNLQGVEPISVFLRRIDENCIRLHSIDKGAVYTCTKFSDFESAPIGYDLIVNALHYFGFTENEGRSLESLLEQIGGGIELTTICAVPRGSGLGGTSILTAAVLKALYSLFGKAPSLDQLLKDTIHVEQLSGAGSGWQDILGGIHGGIKLLQSAPGHFPQLKISHLNTDLFTVPHLKSCFTLVNTGLKRQNNDISMMVSDLMNENIPSYEYSLLQLKSHALETAEMVSTSNITGLGSILNKCDRTNTRIHPFLSNNEMGVLLDGVMPFYSGVKFTGAGGGGFALFISETPGKAEKLQDMLRSLKNPEVEIVDFTLNTKGLSTTIL